MHNLIKHLFIIRKLTIISTKKQNYFPNNPLDFQLNNNSDFFDKIVDF